MAVDDGASSPFEGAALPFTLAGRYEVQELLGEGGMGLVYRARDLTLGRVVALKVVRSLPDRASELRKRFVREAKAMAAVEHPNVIRLYDVHEGGEPAFFTMEYVQGDTLLSLIKRRALDVRQSVAFVAQAAGALAAVHRTGLLHRDVKPQNVMVTLQGQAKLMDFGLARFLEAEGVSKLTQTGHMPGTLGFLPPEVLLGGAWSEHGDVYALGVTAYQVLARGAMPLTTQQVVLRLDSAIEPPSSHWPEVDPELDAVVMAGMAFDPGTRTATAAEVQHRLEAWLETPRTAARRPPAPPTPARRGPVLALPAPLPPRHRLIVAAGVVLAAVLTTSALLSLRGREEPQVTVRFIEPTLVQTPAPLPPPAPPTPAPTTTATPAAPPTATPTPAPPAPYTSGPMATPTLPRPEPTVMALAVALVAQPVAPPATAVATSPAGSPGIIELLEAATRGSPAAEAELGSRYRDGDGVPRDPVTALAWYQKAADQGFARGQLLLGRCYEQGQGATRDLTRAFGLYEAAALQGDVAARKRLARCYARGVGVRVDEGAATYWSQLAATGSTAPVLASAAPLGEPTPGPEVVTAEPDAPATEPEDAEPEDADAPQPPPTPTPTPWASAKERLQQGLALRDAGRPEEAFARFLSAAEEGNAEAQDEVGRSYDLGVGVPRDPQKAVRWYQKAAEKGLAAAQYHLACSYSRGDGVAQDPWSAVSWFEKAAGQGHLPAQFAMGEACQEGRGRSRDRAAAVHWMLKAGEAGYLEAQEWLFESYEKGLCGLVPNPLMAAHWRTHAHATREAQAKLGSTPAK